MPARIAFGALPYDMVHLLGAGMLVLSFALLWQRRVSAVINIYAAQGIVLAVAAAWQGFVQDTPHFHFIALLVCVGQAIVIPVALRRVAHRPEIDRGRKTALGIFPSLILGGALVVMAILVVLPTLSQVPTLTREALAISLAVVLLGLLMMITRHTALTQAIGFLSLQNGFLFAAIGIAGMPWVAALCAACLVMVAFIVCAVLCCQIRERFDSLDLHHLDRVGEAHR